MSAPKNAVGGRRGPRGRQRPSPRGHNTRRPSHAGARSVTWNGRNGSGALVRPGVYLARVTLEGEARTQAIVMTR